MEKRQRDFENQLRTMVIEHSSAPWRVGYSIATIGSLVLVSGVFFFISLVYSRLILREIIVAARVFSTVTLLLANLALMIPTWIFVFLFVTVMLTPLLWLLLPIIYWLSKASVYWLLSSLAGGSIAGLAFGSPTHKIISLVGFLPSLGAICITAMSGVALHRRELFHRATSALLLRCAEKGPLRVAIGILGLISGIILILFQTRRYWK
jgi:hypothetical protein